MAADLIVSLMASFSDLACFFCRGFVAAAIAGSAHAQEEEVRIFYQRYGHGATKVLIIIGLAGPYESWGLQVKSLTGAMEPVDEEAPAGDDSGVAEGVEVCCYDNRGMGRSSVPEQKSQYTCLHRVFPLVTLLHCWLDVPDDVVRAVAQFLAGRRSWRDDVEGRASAHGSPGMVKSACLRPLHG
ncbi:putative aminoacrylate hydrolase RutD [Panicum miliaceum]|uniref:Aminoacrylate hydrolase RutD n=1 Tax=Panicum miliaceum TaxID=4540 RepID=A0A3L6S1R0_PANMI|nr:putative aminoacrylate hydrolase RutD [Panicum miliaceum]